MRKATPVTKQISTHEITALLDKNCERPLDLVWAITSLNKAVESLHEKWADTLGITGAQWLVLLAIRDLDRVGGVAGTEVAHKMRVDPSFISSQTRVLLKQGLVSRTVSSKDARIVLLSLTSTASAALDAIGGRERSLHDFIFSAFKKNELKSVTNACCAIDKRYRKALLMLELESE
jgi:MarR family transcriptional regulator, organic hydroperoxide resistance regulator